MSVKNNKGVAAQALLEMDSIVSAIKEESKKTLGGMLNEAVKNALRESVEDDDEKDYEVIDDENDGAEDKKGKTSKKKTSSSDVSEDENDELEGGMSQGGQQMPQGGAQAGAGMQQAGGATQGGMQSDPSMGGEEEAPMGGEDAGMDSAAGADAEGGNDEGWDEFSDYKVGDDTYDLTGENDYDNVVKIYKLLNDEDEVVVKKDGNTLQLKDNNAGTEYVIDLGGDSDDASADMEEPMSGEEDPSSLNEEEDFGNIAGFPGDEEDDFEGDGLDGMDDFDDTEDPLGGDDLDFEDDGLSDDTFASDNLGDDDEFGPDDEGWDEREEEFGNIGEKPWDRGSHFDDEEPGMEDELGGEDELDNNEIFENKRMKKPMKESKQVLFEVDLGYTDNYQDKDPIKGLSNNEPSKSGKSWHKGVPTGTSKPWAGQSKPKGKPFGEKTIEEGEDCCPKCGKCGAECTCDKEIEEANLSQSKWNDTHAVHNRVPAANQDEYRRKGMQKTSKGNEYRATSSTNESKELKAIKAENRELKKAVLELRKNLNEAYITNVNLGKITKLFLENTTSKAEKIDIVNRFANNAKTVEQSKALFESISRELKKNGKSNPMNLNESSMTAKGTKELNENAGYKSPDVLKTIDFMNRVLNC